MFHTLKQHKWLALLSASLLIMVLLLTACGGGTATTGASSAPQAAPNSSSSNNGPTNTGAGSSQKPSTTSPTSNVGPQYLIKSLAVTMQVKDTRKVAADLQSWITTTDTRSSSAGIDYEQTGDNSYSVTMTFTVEAPLYPQIESYLRDYSAQHGGKLLALHESVQDVTNDFIDTQSRLKNLRGEQERLLVLLGHATVLSDILDLEQRLTDVEGQIEDTEAHLNALSGQVAYYNVTINLQPTTLTTPPPPAPKGWNPGQVLHDAWSSALGLGQVLVTFLLWLLAFSIYIIPLAILAWWIWRYRARLQHQLARATAAPGPASPPSSAPHA